MHSVSCTDEAMTCPTGFLNTLDVPGIPSRILDQKVGEPIMLLRNLQFPSLSNVTQLTVQKLMSNIIEAIIMTQLAAGEDVFIPRIPIIPSDFIFQFPVQVLP